MCKVFAAIKDVTLSITDENGNPAPGWVYLNASSDQGTIAVGESREIGITFAPSTDVSEGMYTFHLHLESSNYQTTDIDLNVSVTQSGVGSLLFKVQDIYTGTLDADNQLIQGVSGARVKLQNEEVFTQEYTLNTDSVGEAYFTDLPAGHYKCRITANNHQEYIGRVWIKPGVPANEEVFLDYNLVTVEWEVNEITIEDKYEIVLNATYETDVPAAVVIAEPSSITLPSMKAGDVYNGEFTLTNYGLIRADNVTYAMPQDDQYFHYELLQGLPTSLNAKDRITVAFMVTCIQSPDQSEGDGTGGGCERSAGCARIDYDYTCPAGKVFHDSGICCFIYDNGQCNVATQNSGSGNAAGGTWNLGGGGSGSSNVSTSQAPSQMAGVKCFPLCELKEWFFKKKRALKETWQNIIHKVGCSVNTATREFNDDRVDLSVKVPGGTIEVKRWFYRDKWHWEHIRNNLSFKQNSLGDGIESIDKGGVTYKSSPTQENIYTSGTYKIIRESDGTYRWKDKSGNWKTFDATGLMTAYGTRNGVVGKLLYDSGEDGKLTGVTDRNDTQVIWYEYDGDGNISAVHDADNRRVEYSYTINGINLSFLKKCKLRLDIFQQSIYTILDIDYPQNIQEPMHD